MALALCPALAMQSYSRWNLMLARRMANELMEHLERQAALEGSIVGDESELRSAIVAQTKQLRAMDESIGQIFGRMQALLESPLAGNRTVRNQETQVGKRMPPFPGAAAKMAIVQQSTPGTPEVKPEGFVATEELPAHLRKRVDPALADPS